MTVRERGDCVCGGRLEARRGQCTPDSLFCRLCGRVYAAAAPAPIRREAAPPPEQRIVRLGAG